MELKTIPDNLEEVENDNATLRTLLVSEVINCDSCGYEGHPERVHFFLDGDEACYCPDCGTRLQ